MQRDFPVLACLQAVNPAPIERPGVDVKANGALFKFGEVKNLVHWLGGVYLGWHIFVNVERIRRFETAVSGVVSLFQHAKVLHAKPAYRNCHPAVLIMVVVYLRSLSYLPTDRYQLEQIVLEDQIACVVFLAADPARQPLVAMLHRSLRQRQRTSPPQ